jgi:cation transport ATPase
MPEKVNGIDVARGNRLEILAWVFGAGIGGFAFWFGILYPLIPTSPMGWLIEIVAGTVVALWAAISILAISWLQRQTRHPNISRLIAVGIAISLGVGIFLIAVNAQALMAENVSYFGR